MYFMRYYFPFSLILAAYCPTHAMGNRTFSQLITIKRNQDSNEKVKQIQQLKLLAAKIIVAAAERAEFLLTPSAISAQSIDKKLKALLVQKGTIFNINNTLNIALAPFKNKMKTNNHYLHVLAQKPQEKTKEFERLIQLEGLKQKILNAELKVLNENYRKIMQALKQLNAFTQLPENISAEILESLKVVTY